METTVFGPTDPSRRTQVLTLSLHVKSRVTGPSALLRREEGVEKGQGVFSRYNIDNLNCDRR